MSSEQTLQVLQNHLVIHCQEVGDTLRHFNAEGWKVCVFVWNPDELDANIVTMPLSVSNDQLLAALTHAVSNPDRKETNSPL